FQPWLDDHLRFRPDVDFSISPEVLGLVSVGAVHPNLSRGLQVTATHDADFIWSGAGKELDLGHRLHCRRKKGDCGLNVGLGHGLDRLGLFCLGSASTQAFKGAERLMDSNRNNLLACSPLEESLDPADVLVDPFSAKAILDHFLLDGF